MISPSSGALSPSPLLPPPSSCPLQKYKGIWNCLTILTRALGGNYVNFGVFELYGDPALKVVGRAVGCMGRERQGRAAWGEGGVEVKCS